MSEPKKRARKVKTDRETRAETMQDASAEARRVAAVVLEVLAGILGTGEAAEVLGWSPPQYYKAEARALEGLLRGCEPRPRGRRRNPEQELATAQTTIGKLEREVSRLQSLVRAMGKAAGVKRKRPAGKKETGTAKKGKRGRKKPSVRALRLVEELKKTGGAAAVEPSPPSRPNKPQGDTSPAPESVQG